MNSKASNTREQPESANPGQPKAMEAGLPNDPDAGQPKAAVAGLPDDPHAGQPKAMEAGLPDDPDAGQPKAAVAGLPDGPHAGQPETPVADRTGLITQTCLLAGKIILQNGGETYRVEDTMVRIAAAYGAERAHSFVTPTGIIFAMDGSAQATRLVRISERSTNLKKVSMVNRISRQISGGELAAEEAYKQLRDIDASAHEYRSGLKALAAAVASGCFLIMFGGSWHDFLPVLVTGGLGFICFLILHHFVQIKFFAEFLTSIAIGSLAVLAVHTGIGSELDKIIVGSVMPLVPGLHITNAVRDLMAGHLVSGLSKGAEAFLTAFAIGSGIAAVLSFY